MTLAEAKQKLARFGQEHVLKYYEELDEAGREALLQQIAETDMSILASCMHKEELVQKGKITLLQPWNWRRSPPTERALQPRALRPSGTVR